MFYNRSSQVTYDGRFRKLESALAGLLIAAIIVTAIWTARAEHNPGTGRSSVAQLTEPGSIYSNAHSNGPAVSGLPTSFAPMVKAALPRRRQRHQSLPVGRTSVEGPHHRR